MQYLPNPTNWHPLGNRAWKEDHHQGNPCHGDTFAPSWIGLGQQSTRGGHINHDAFPTRGQEWHHKNKKNIV
eukprot:scaffold213894_cov20-Attheya_sp.AAC.1